MLELYQLCIQPANLPATILLGLVILYWLLLTFGAATVDFFDFDFDTDVDGASGIVGDTLSFFNLGNVPFMILASFFSLSYWVTTVCCNYNFNTGGSYLTSLYFLAPCVIVSLFVTKLMSQPLVPLFGDRSGDVVGNLVGRRATVSTLELNDQYGEITIEIDGPPVVVTAVTANGQRLHRHDPVVITHFDPETRIYFVEPQKLEDN